MEAVINKTANLAGTDFYSLSAVFTSLGLFLGGVVPELLHRQMYTLITRSTQTQ